MGRPTAAQWNERHPVGTAVLYRPLLDEPLTHATKTRSHAWELGDGTPVVLVEGRTGGMSLAHLEVDPMAITAAERPYLAHVLSNWLMAHDDDGWPGGRELGASILRRLRLKGDQ